MAKTALCLALLALLAITGEATNTTLSSPSYNKLCKTGGKPTKFKAKIMSGGKTAGRAKFCFSGSGSSLVAYTSIKLRKIFDFNSVVFSGDKNNTIYSPITTELPVGAINSIKLVGQVDTPSVGKVVTFACDGSLNVAVVTDGVTGEYSLLDGNGKPGCSNSTSN